MKKALLLASMSMAAILMTACDTKPCKCYVYNGVSEVYMETDYVSEGTSCSTLDYTQGNQYRICTEYNEPDIDPTQIGEQYKKR